VQVTSVFNFYALGLIVEGLSRLQNNDLALQTKNKGFYHLRTGEKIKFMHPASHTKPQLFIKLLYQTHLLSNLYVLELSVKGLSDL